MARNLDIDSHAWMKRLRLEYCRVAQLRELRVGEMFWIGYFAGPGITEDMDGHCEAYIERIRGGYRFAAIWTLLWGRVDRAHVMTSGQFKLLPGNLIRFASAEDLGAERPFRQVCRYIEYIDRHCKDYGIPWIYWRGRTVLRNGYTTEGYPSPRPRGLEAIVETAMGVIGAIDFEDFPEAATQETSP